MVCMPEPIHGDHSTPPSLPSDLAFLTSKAKVSGARTPSCHPLCQEANPRSSTGHPGH